MIDQSNLKSPGWAKVIAELSAHCADDRTYLDRLLRIIAKVSTAKQAVLAVPAGGENAQPDVRVLSIWPSPGLTGESGDKVVAPPDAAAIEFAADVRSAAWSAIDTAQSRAFSLDAKNQFYDAAPGAGTLLAIPVSGGTGLTPGAADKPVAAITLLLEPRTKQAIQSTLAMAEVLAGYTAAHAARQQLRRTQSTGMALDLATRLIGAINSSTNFKGACMQLTNDLAKQLGADRAALGWVLADKVRTIALSDTEYFDRRTAMVQKIEAAMDECLDQEQPVVHPAPPADQDVLLSQAISHAHRELAGGNPGLRIISVPLRDGDKTVGVITLETSPPAGTSAAPIDLQAVELIQAAVDLVAPVLRIRRSDDRNLALRAWDSAVRTGAWAVGPKHTVWKVVGVLLIAATLFVTFFTMTYRVGADFTLAPRTRRVISVPFDSVISELGLNAATGKPIEAGASVKAGDLLVQMDTVELELAAQEAMQKITQAEKEMTAARSEGKIAEMQRAEAARGAADAQYETVTDRIRRARIVSPVSGTVLAGRLNDRLGSSVKLGDKLFEIAPLEGIIAVAKVDERDVSFIVPGTTGKLATRSHPGDRFELVVESVVPLAAADEGKNLFEVRARLVNPATAWMRPGMEGIARLDAGERSLLFIGTRRVVDAIRLWLW
ncbi:MAG: efflux RND transporter periplasmic adaptor subunit [Phycisphaerales bacterium]